ncbi:U32 family peptidase [Myxococcota bacterium]|nr:U32 family peptidase [Myxococcota bacterium]MBU1897649.1 U32 family peptidase [Myxococcota bacterium]
MTTTPQRPEILAPAGDTDALRAALAAGADAVYFGLADGFNARAKASGVPLAELADYVKRIHHAGARAYLTLNTLIFDPELEAIEALLPKIAEAGIDALIIQDPAVARLAQAICPTLELHASTQMTISSAEGIRFAQGLGARRIVVPRELSVKEIQRLKAQTDVELEVFIHGALCVSWSGQCLTSEAWGGRSANRGQCAQSCRMPYQLYVDGQARPLGEVRYLLSPKDLAGVRAVEPLIEAGVRSFKIEGRYKGPAYVISTTLAYRRWISAALRPGGPTEADRARLADDLTDMALIFSRGFSDGFLGGDDHQHLVEGRFPKHRGVLLGEVTRVARHGVEIIHAARPRTGGLGLGEGRTAPQGQRGVALPVLGGSPTDATGAAAAPLRPKPGMGVVFDAGHPEDQAEPGGPIFKVSARPDGWRLDFGQPGPDLTRVKPGDLVWVTGDPALERRARKIAEAQIQGQIPLKLWISGRAGAPLHVEASAAGQRAQISSDQPLTPALGEGLTRALLQEKLGALGQSPFQLLDLNASALAPGLHLPVSALKQLRRRLTADLSARIDAHRGHEISARAPLKGLRAQAQARAAACPTWGDETPLLIPLCRAPAHLDAVIAAGLGEVELDWMERGGLERAVERARAAGLRVHIATPRVQKPGEEGFDRRLARLRPDGALIRHWGALMHLLETPQDQRPELHGDFSLNVTNSLTADHLLGMGLDTLTPAHDLDADQLFALIQAQPADRLTVTIHQHIPTFHTEHCVYAHTLSNGRDILSCGKPCLEHEIGLQDHLGRIHPVIVDPACRNTVYNAQAQSAAGLIPRLIEAGVKRLRIELVREGGEEALKTLRGYQALLKGALDASTLIKQLGLHEQFGVTAIQRAAATPRIR